MAYGKIKADTIVWDNSGTDTDVSVSDIANKAGLASPAFTGTPTAPTAAAGTNTTQIATTAFVEAAAGNKLIEEGSTYRIQFIAIGGGGAGAYGDSGWSSGGGGAGGLAYHDGFMVTDGDSYTVTIGGGANGPTSDAQMGGYQNSQAPNGGDTTVTGTGMAVTAYGGGGGAGYNGAYLQGAAGGCGGGSEGGGNPMTYPEADGYARGANGGTSCLGWHGGNGSTGANDVGDGTYGAGGGGGLGGSPPRQRSLGGQGTTAFHEWLAATSTGELVSGIRYIGAGGGGGNYSSSTNAAGGNGGAGDGGNSTGSSGGDATDGTGSGGGGRGNYSTGSGRGGNGGDGIVIFRYPDNKGQKASGGTVSQSGGWYYHVFTSSGTFTA